MRAAVLAMLTLFLAERACAHVPLIMGIDHIPIVVADLEKAQEDFRAMGFVIKPGRFHADGIRNAHVKFPDGTEIELITAPAGTDALTSEYRRKLQGGDGPVYWGLYAPDHAALAARLRALGVPVRQEGDILTFPFGEPLHPLFFGLGEKAATDRPEHFAHANTALRLSGLWLRGNVQERALLRGLGVPLHRTNICGPGISSAEVAALPEGDVILAGPESRDGGVMGARIEVKSLTVLQALWEKDGLDAQHYPGCGSASLWLPPAVAHGIWLQFVQRR